MHYDNRKTKRNVQEKKVGENFLSSVQVQYIKYKGKKNEWKTGEVDKDEGRKCEDG